jgi:acyl-CoA synthetase (NDP forming)
MPVVASFMGGESVKEGMAILTVNGVAHFRTPEAAVRGLSSLRRDSNTQYAVSNTQASDSRKTQAIGILEGTEGLLSEEKVKQLFSLYDLPLPAQALAHDPKEALDIAKRIGFPVIAKVSCREILHKTDVGGVRGNLKTAKEVETAFTDILSNVRVHHPDAHIDGILIQRFLPAGNEFIVGGLRDPSFGPMVMAGLGGIYTELFKDTSFRIAPIDEEEAYRMLTTLRSWKLLLGMRGENQRPYLNFRQTKAPLIRNCKRRQFLR